MTPVKRTAMLVSLAVAAVAISAALMGGAEAPPAAITSDTPAYCHELSERAHVLAALRPAPSPRTDDLVTQGRSLCARGQIRGGLLRLREAVRLMRGTAERPH